MKVSKNFIESIKEKLRLDNTELYDSSGKTIVDIQDMDTKEILEILDIKKDCQSSQK